MEAAAETASFVWYDHIGSPSLLSCCLWMVMRWEWEYASVMCHDYGSKRDAWRLGDFEHLNIHKRISFNAYLGMVA